MLGSWHRNEGLIECDEIDCSCGTLNHASWAKGQPDVLQKVMNLRFL